MSQVASQQRVSQPPVSQPPVSRGAVNQEFSHSVRHMGSQTGRGRQVAHALVSWTVKLVIIATLVVLGLVVVAAWRPDVLTLLLELM